MEEKLVSFKTAVLAEEKGFDEYCYSCIGLEHKDSCFIPSEFGVKEENSEHIRFGFLCNSRMDEFNVDYISRPSQVLLQKWLREEHNIIVQVVFSNVTSHDGNKILYYIQIGVKRKESNYYDRIDMGYNESTGYYDITRTPYTSSEGALEIGLYEALNLIK